MTQPDQNIARLHKELEALHARVADLEKAATERQRDHEAVQASEQRYRAIVEDQTEFVSRHTTGGVLTFVNEALCRYVGMNREELVGQSYLPFIFDEDRKILLQHLSSLTCENPVDTIEHRVMLDNRGVRWLQWTNRAIYDEAGRFAEFQSVGRDITDRKRAEESLKETTELLEHLLKVSPTVVYRCEPSGSYPATFISANVEKQLGYEPRQFTNDPQFWASHIHPDDAPRIFAELADIFQRDCHTHEYRFLHQDGTYRWMRDELRLTRDAEGNPLDIVGSWVDITDRKQAELELAEAGQRLDYLLSSSPAVVYSCGAGPEYATTFISGNISALLGYRPEDFYNDPRFWEKAVHSDDRSRILAKLHRVERGEALSYEYRFRHADGHYVWLHDKLIPIQDPDGRVIEIIGSWFDVSARREAERALRESEAQYRNLFDRVPVGLYRTTPDGRILDANLTLIEMLGYPDRDTLLRAGASSLYAEPDARGRLLEQINRTGVAQNLEFELEHRDGTRIWVRENVRAIRNTEGAVTSYEGSLEDVTKRRQAVTQLETERQKLRSYFDTMIDGVGIANERGEIVDVNKSLVQMLGYESREDVVGKTVFDLAGLRDRSTVERRFAEAIQNRTRFIAGLESSYRRRDGTEFPVLLNITNVWNDDGTFAGNLAVIRDITEQKLAELALRESEERYRAIVNDQTELICRFTPDLNLTFVNGTYCRYFGKDAEDLIGHSFLPLIPSEDREKVRQHLAQLTPENPVASHEHMVLGAHGEVCWQQWTNRVIVGEDGVAKELQGVGRDVTERKQAEAALRESEERFRAIFEQAAVGVAQIVTETGQYLHVNQRYCDIVGLTPEEMKSTTFMEITHPDDLQEDLDNRERLRAGMIRDFSTEKRYIRKDGSTVWVNLSVAAMSAAGQQSACHIAVVEDITERKLAQEHLKASERRYRELHEGSRDGFGLVDMEGRIVECNTTFTEMLGYTKHELSRMTYQDLTVEKWRELDAKIMREQVLVKGYSDVYEKEYRRKDGTILPAELRRYLLRDENGTPTGMWAFVRDLTERKAAEQARGQLEAQLRHSHKLKAVGQLAAGVAHDFNSLLAVILGNAELMERRLMRQEADAGRATCTAGLEQIVDAVERGRSLVQKLLTFGRARTWKPQAIELNTVVTGMRQILASALGSPISLTAALAPDLHRIKGDTMQMEQVIMNLILNARDAMPTGGELTIETSNVNLDDPRAAAHAEATPGPYVRLTVKDTGAGISPEFLDRIFDPFFSTKFPDKGTGLGLSIVHGIVKQAGGHIIVESQLEKGTTFDLYFPAVG